MAKARNFSVFLIKEGREIDGLFVEDRVYDGERDLEGLPDGSFFFIIENPPRPPWWKEYFHVKDEIQQQQHGAIYVLPAGGRLFCICFGMVSHYLDNDVYEYDFGLRITLNSIDPKKLRSTDSIVTGPSLRQRTQVPTDAELTFFDFDYEGDVLKGLVGKVKDEYKSIFNNATGADNLRVNSKAEFADLGALCEDLLRLYLSDDFEAAFPGLRNISPVKDPSLTSILMGELLVALKAQSTDVDLMVPDLINYHANVYASFNGAGASKLYSEVYIGRYYEHLNSSKMDLAALDLEQLKKQALCLADEEEEIYQRYAILKCFVFDVTHDGETYHLRDGQWFRVQADYIASMKDFLDPMYGNLILPDYCDATEGEYNARVTGENKALICMDTMSISPIKSNQIEPCDIYSVQNDTRRFVHVKVSTLSSTLSHLFNQGVNPVSLLKTNQHAREALHTIISSAIEKNESLQSIAVDDFDKVEVIYAIVSRKDVTKKSDNLPLFSRISLMRSLKALLSMSVIPSYVFVKDVSPPKPGKAKARKSKKAVPSVPF